MKKTMHIISLLALLPSATALASYEIEVSKGHQIAFGGYVKADLRYVDGDVAYQDYWLGNIPAGSPTDTQTLALNVKESRFNFKYSHDDTSAFLEFDLYGGGGNEVVSNSANPRLRHAFIKYQGFLVGQTWTTFMNTSALMDSLDFAGPTVGSAFIRQPQVRYSINGFDFAIENPETNGDGDIGATSSGVGLSGTNADDQERFPDLIAKYTLTEQWGQVSTAALIRKVDQGDDGIDETATALSVAGKINLGQDDFRFQVSVGETGRYVGPGFTTDIVDAGSGDEIEKTTAFAIGYRHLWREGLRSTVYYGNAESDVLERDRSHWGVNLIRDLNKQLMVGAELGNFSVDDEGSDTFDSNYLQISMKFNL